MTAVVEKELQDMQQAGRVHNCTVEISPTNADELIIKATFAPLSSEYFRLYVNLGE